MIGQTIDQYRILGQLGAGAMGVVYQARDSRLDRTVALKFLPPHLSSDVEARRRFLNEAQAASVLDHPNVCTVHGLQEHRGHSFIVMEYIEGQTLKQRIRRGGLDLEEAVDVVEQATQGLQAAHAKGITHRDIKPANLMVNATGQVKIMDFGIAKLMDDAGMTQTGTTVGTAAYMAPEQTRGAPVDQRADLWSVGVVLYEMVTGERPFKGDYVPAVIYSIMNTEPELPRHVPEPLGYVIRRLLRKDPRERYPDAAALLADLKVFQRTNPSTIVARPDTMTEPAPGLTGFSDPFVRYLNLRAELKRIELQIQDLQPQVLELLWEAEDNKVRLLGHELSVATRKSYEYSDVVLEMQQAVRNQKKAEEREGIAVLDRHTSFVVVRKSRRDGG